MTRKAGFAGEKAAVLFYININCLVIDKSKSESHETVEQICRFAQTVNA